jgi:ferritin-like metal-binding protein YciE
VADRVLLETLLRFGSQNVCRQERNLVNTVKRTTSRSSNKRLSAGADNSEESEGQMDMALHQLFLDELADLYSAEQQLLKALPKMAKAAQNEELREAFESHLSQTEEHVKRLESVAESLGEQLKRKTCAAMKGLVEEAQELMKEQKGTTALDAALIAAAQKVEHYEIASYGTVCAWARQMGHDSEVDVLEETLNEEKETDEKLTSIAESAANAEGENA